MFGCLFYIIYRGDIMKAEENYERKDIYNGEKRIGIVSVRYPCFQKEFKRINRFYGDMAASYIHFAEKNIPKMKKRSSFDCVISCVLYCKVTYSDENCVSVRCEVRIYTGNEKSFVKCFSNVWYIPECRFAYKRRYLLRHNNITYNGKAFDLFIK